MGEAYWIGAVEAELARLERQARPEFGTAAYHAFDVGQADEFVRWAETAGGRLYKTRSGDWAFRIGGRTSTSTSGWRGAVTNRIAAERKGQP